MKKFISGFICGAIIFSMAGAFAVNSIYDNPYPIIVNGEEKRIQGYNIDDYSYFKLRDIASALGNFSVAFDDETIVLKSGDVPAPEVPAPGGISEMFPGETTEGISVDNAQEQTNDFASLGIDTPYVLDEDGVTNVTNDAFRIQVNIENFENEDGGTAVADVMNIVAKANELAGFERYKAFGHEIRGAESNLTEITLSSASVTLYEYYTQVVPWLESIGQ